ALELLIMQPQIIKSRREEAVARLGRSIKSNNPNNALAINNSAATIELQKFKQALTDERIARARAEAEVKSHLDKFERTIYKEYVRGIIAGESISISAYEQLRIFRDSHGITNNDHQAVLSELGITTERFEAMKHFELSSEKECVVCQDNRKDH